MSDELERWAPRLAADLDHLARHQVELVEPEAAHLRDTTRRLAPRQSGVLRRSILARGLSVVSESPYALLQSEGGIVRARRHGWLTVPVRPGYSPRAGLVTVRGRDGHQYVVRSGTLELWAVRRREVRIRGSRYLERALDAHLTRTDDRVLGRLRDEVE